MENKKYLSAKQAAELLGLKMQTLYTKVYNKELPYYKTGKLLRFEENELIAWMDKRKISPDE